MATASKVIKSKTSAKAAPVKAKTSAAKTPVKTSKAPVKAPAKAVKKTAAPAKSSTKTSASAKTAAKPVAKKTTRRAAPEVAALKPCRQAFTANEIFAKAAARAEIEPKQAKAVIGFLQDLMVASLKKGGVGTFNFFGLFGMKIKEKPAQKIAAIKKGTMIANPFAGGEMQPHKGRPAGVKPASRVPKILARKKLKDLVAA